MPRPFTTLAWTAATCAYLLIVLGAVVRITGSGMGCGDHWPLCNGHLFPPLGDVGTVIEWSHRLVAALLSALVAALAGYAWRLRRDASAPTHRTAYLALGLLLVQVLLGAVTVKLALPPWTVIVHLGTAMLLLAALLVAAIPGPHPLSPSPLRYAQGRPFGRGRTIALLALAFVTVLFGALTANLGAAAACAGFPLCNGQLIPDGGALQYVHWTHRLLAYALFGCVIWWAVRTREAKAAGVAALIGVQIVVAAGLVLLGLPGILQAAHVAVGAGVWAAMVIAARGALAPPTLR
jgi:heme A synthase